MPLRPLDSAKDPPPDLICPLSKELFTEPVLADDGFTYEASAIKAEFSSCVEQKIGLVSPVTKEKMRAILVPNAKVKARVEKYLLTINSSVEYPKEWPSFRDGLHVLDLNSPLALHICQHFSASLGHLADAYRVTSLKLNVNKALWAQYTAARKSMKALPREAYLVHGPNSQKTLDTILKEGLSVEASHGGALGRGIYGADSLVYVIDAEKMVVDGKKGKCIIARFLLGTTRPCAPDKRSLPEGANSTSARAVGGSVFCVYKQGTTYPEFELTVEATGKPSKKLDSAAMSSPSSFASVGAVNIPLDQAENPIVEIIHAPMHPCTFRREGSSSMEWEKGVILGSSLKNPEKFMVRRNFGKDDDKDEDSIGGALITVPERNIRPVPGFWLPPWKTSGVVFRCDARARKLLEFLEQPIEGLTSSNPAIASTFMSVFRHHRETGVVLFFFGGAIRHALLDDFQGINDVDVTFGTAPSEMVRHSEHYFSPVAAMGLKVRWGEGRRVMEGNCMMGCLVTPCFVMREGIVVTNDLVDNLMTVDFACNSVLFDPIAQVFVDVTGHGLHDILWRRLRIPVPRPEWDLWFGQNHRKVFRYWKMRLLGYEADTDVMHDFLMKKTEELITDVRAANSFLLSLGKTKRKIKHSLPALRDLILEECGDAFDKGVIRTKADVIWGFVAEAFKDMVQSIPQGANSADSSGVGEIQNRGEALRLLDPDYDPPRSCRSHLETDLPLVLTTVTAWPTIIAEALRRAEKSLKALSSQRSGLPFDQALAIAAYTYDLSDKTKMHGRDNLFVALNNVLRDRRPEHMELLKPFLTYLMRGLTALPVETREVFRGVPRDSLSVVQQKYKEGTIVHWSAFTSTSLKLSTAKGFARGRGGVIFQIKTYYGRKITEYSCIPDEDEARVL